MNKDNKEASVSPRCGLAVTGHKQVMTNHCIYLISAIC